MKKLFSIFLAISLFIASIAIADIIRVELVKENRSDSKLAFKFRFYKNDQIIAERSYKEGKLIDSKGIIPDGMVIENHDDGRVKNIMFYQNNLRNGPVVSIYPSGKIKMQTYYKDGNPIGKGFYYYENGQIMAEWETKDGKDIYHREYNEDGTLKYQK